MNVYRAFSRCFAALFLLLLTDIAYAARPDIGLFNSFKGFGAGLLFEKEGKGYADEFTVYADIFGMPLGTVGDAGIKFTYSRNYYWSDFEIEGVGLSLYAGPGVALGYVHDSDKGNPGILGSLCGNAGAYISFGKAISLSFGFTAEFGLHLRKDERFDIPDLSFYKNGVFQSFHPQLTIYYNL